MIAALPWFVVLTVTISQGRVRTRLQQLCDATSELVGDALDRRFSMARVLGEFARSAPKNVAGRSRVTHLAETDQPPWIAGNNMMLMLHGAFSAAV